MNRLRSTTIAALGIVAGAALFASPLRAQITEVARTPIADAAQVTFGYVCDDRFMIRNDGTKSIDLEYGLEKGDQHTRITLNARESVELNSPSKAPMELWMDGKLIAKAIKDRRSCKDVVGNSQVTVVAPDRALDGATLLTDACAWAVVDYATLSTATVANERSVPRCIR